MQKVIVLRLMAYEREDALIIDCWFCCVYMFVWTEIRPLLTHVVIVIVLYRDIDNRCLHLQFIADVSNCEFHNQVYIGCIKKTHNRTLFFMNNAYSFIYLLTL